MEKEKETKTYLMRMKPLEPYTFGTDIGFRFKMEETAGKKKEKEIAGKVSYLIPSKEMPEQTTVLGILRYLILKEKDILCPDFRYSSKEQEKNQDAYRTGEFSIFPARE